MTDGTIVLSLNEVETLSAKAARGAGFGWGTAEDIGRAARWLAARELAWAEPLLRLLHDLEVRHAFHRAQALADRVMTMGQDDQWSGAPVDPIWLVPLLSAALHGRAFAITLTCGGRGFDLRPDGGVATDGSGLALAQAMPAMIEPVAASRREPAARDLVPGTRRSIVSMCLWERIGAFAALTYVPASALSRSRGAGGAGLDGE